MGAPPFARVAVMGAGAVGSFYGAMLARAGHAVTLIARPTHAQAIRQHGLKLEMAGRVETVHLAAGDDVAAVHDADLVLCCVKSTGTEAAALQMRAHLKPGAVLMSLQNGVDNAEVLARHLGCPVIPAVVYVATALPAPGLVQHFGRGDLVIGRGPGDRALPEHTLQQLVELFASVGVAVRVSADVQAELWSKLLVNCAYNAISGLAQLPYARLAALPAIGDLQAEVVREVVDVAAASGVRLSLPDALNAVAGIAQAMPAQLSSTAQDMARRKPSEIDHLNGYIARRGSELGVATPTNRTLHALVKLVESGYEEA